MTALQVKLLNHAVQKRVGKNGLLESALELHVGLPEIVEITGENDMQRLDREMDDLREVGLLDGGSGFSVGVDYTAILTPSALGFHLYVRCQGSRLSPAAFFGVM